MKTGNSRHYLCLIPYIKAPERHEKAAENQRLFVVLESLIRITLTSHCFL